MKFLKIASLCIVGMFIFGCGNSMPSCNDTDVKNLLEKIVKESLEKMFGNSAKEISVSFSGFATNEKNEAKKQVTCQAMAKITHTKTGKSEENTIHYTARHTDDGHVYVEIEQ